MCTELTRQYANADQEEVRSTGTVIPTVQQAEVAPAMAQAEDVPASTEASDLPP